MKTNILYTTLLVLMTSVIALPVNATESEVHHTHAQQAATMLQRLETIKEMNVRSMSSAQQKDLQTEVQAIHQNLKTLDGGIYLSVGAIIIILLILLLIL